MQYIHFSAEISQAAINTLVEVLQDCAASDDSDVHLLFNSEGGGVWPGQHARTMLQSYPGEVSICNVGVAHSAAISVFLAVDKRSCARGATFAFHNITRSFAAGTSLNMKEAQAAADATKADTAALVDWIAARTRLESIAIEELYAGHFPVIKDAQWALDNGFVDAIDDLQINPGKANALRSVVWT